ncbi:glycosyl hydrolase [Robertkochia marina]|uniref:Glycosyl hydrolase n=1 Tax=Robertkochia marina TaxID=1227945 RepID=A0A4S3M5Q2_9FLAO|nr:glycosyl hydrolase [Robertkochia marina]THD69691.1 glycosyl hydrolase [Robertkochia marina]TRZ46963.1 glycosyl hydrolase [Robertkochia marina]
MKQYVLMWILACLAVTTPLEAQTGNSSSELPEFHQLQWRNIGPFRGGRSVACTGIANDPLTYFMGSTGGGIWKTEDAGLSWHNISDPFLKTGTVGAIAVAPSDPNVVYAGMGEHAVRGVMTSSGDGMYRSLDSGKTWTHIGLDNSRHISDIVIHPTDPDRVYVAVQGAQYGNSEERGVYMTTDGGSNWERILFTHEHTGASSLAMDPDNPRILYASMWQHLRFPWTMQSGGEHSGIYKSTNSGASWKLLKEGLPEVMGKSGVTVSPANPDRLWAVIEAEGEKGGVYRSDDAGATWSQVNKDRINIARSWYYMEIFADPQDENTVYVLNAPMLKSVDGGRNFLPIPTPHGDNHDLWINPVNNDIMINANDGGANISMNGGKTWSEQSNQPTAQFYRVITDNQVPYHVYGGQQDNSAIAIASRTTGPGIGWKDWYSVAGCESAFLAFNPEDPSMVFGGCYQGIIDSWNRNNGTSKAIKPYPELALGNEPKDMKFRFNWNAPIVYSQHHSNTIYHAGNVIFKSQNEGIDWELISDDLTRNEKDKQGPGGQPFTNEAAGGENYNTITSVTESPHSKGTLWAGTDDGLLHMTTNEGNSWSNVTPKEVNDGIINSIEVSPHDPETVYITVMRYKRNDLTPYIYKTTNNGNSWKLITDGIDDEHTFARVVREDRKVKDLLYAGTETGLFISVNGGKSWNRFQLNLPAVPINDLTIRQNDLVAATAGRGFWILDDLSPIQQSKLAPPGELTIFQPKDTYLFEGGFSKKFTPGLGQNPRSGVSIDYYIPQSEDSLSLTLEILDTNGMVLRTFENKGSEDFKPWPGGPGKPEALPSESGFNRFTWDFRKEPVPAVEKVFVYGDYSGNRVIPGKYTLRLTSNGQSSETEVTILPNPNIKATTEDFKKQETFLNEIDALITDIHNSVNEMRSAKTQLKGHKKLLKDNEQYAELTNKADTLISTIETWETKLIQPDQKTFQDVINFNNKLNAELMYLKEFSAQEDPRITSGAKERLTDLKKMWTSLKAEQEKIINEGFKGFNELYRQKNIPAIMTSNK